MEDAVLHESFPTPSGKVEEMKTEDLEPRPVHQKEFQSSDPPKEAVQVKDKIVARSKVIEHSDETNISPIAAGKVKKGEVDLSSASIRKDVNRILKLTSPIKSLPTAPSIESSQPSSPTINISQTLPMRNPRTLRLVTTSKSEDSAQSPISGTMATPSPDRNSAKQGIQHYSSASAKPPSTPVNELISETTSLTSASVSRPSTPSVVGRVGSAPITKSKNQTKKERQERARKAEEAKLSEDGPVQEEVVQGPVISRKKKTKKAKTATLVAPVKKTDKENDDSEALAVAKLEEAKEPKPKGMSEVAADIVVAKAKENDKVKEKEVVPAKSVEKPVFGPEAPKPSLTPSSIFAALQDAGLVSPSTLDLFLNPPGLGNKNDCLLSAHASGSTSNGALPSLGTMTIALSSTEKRALNRGDCVAKEVNPNEWGVVLPNRSLLRQLSKPEADRYVNLRKLVTSAGATAFQSADFPADAWLNLTANDFILGKYVAPPMNDNSADETSASETVSPTTPTIAGSSTSHHPLLSTYEAGVAEMAANPEVETPASLLAEYEAHMMRPDPKDAHYSTTYPPRTAAENEEVEERMAMLSLEDAGKELRASQDVLDATHREADALEKRVAALVKRNRRLMRDHL